MFTNLTQPNAQAADRLLAAYRSAMRAADALPAAEKAIVVHALEEASAQARDRLRSRTDGGEADAVRVEQFRESLAAENTIGRGLSLLNEYKGQIQTFGAAVGGWFGAVAVGVLAVLSGGDDTATRGSALTPAEMQQLSTDLAIRFRQMAGPIFAYGGVILGWAGALVAWWNRSLNAMWNTGQQAKQVLDSVVTPAEQEFFSAIGGGMPPRNAVVFAGPAASFAFVAGTAAVVVVGLGLAFGVVRL
jgi:hypothetical protein